MEKKLKLRADLGPEMAEKFFKLKKKWALRSNSETVRHLIQLMYEELMDKEK